MKVVKTNPTAYGRFRNLKVFTKQQFIDFKKYVQDFLTKNYVIPKKKILIPSVKIYVEIDTKGVLHSINVKGSVAKLKSLTAIDLLLKNSALDTIEIDKNDKSKKTLKLSSIVDVDGVLWIGHIVVKQKNNGHYFYDHYLSKFSKIEIP